MKLPAKIILVSLGMGIIFDALLYSVYYPGINILILQILVLATIFGFAKHLKTKIESYSIVAGIFAFLFAGTFTVWTSDLGLATAGFGLFLSNLFLVFSVWGHSLKYQHPFQLVIDTITHGIKLVITRFEIFKHISFAKTHKKHVVLLRGLLIAAPIVLIFAILFLQSDLMLQHQSDAFITWLSETLDTWSIIPHSLIIVFFTALFILLLAAMFWKRFDFGEPESYKMAMATESLVILVATNLLFLAFIIFQSVYLFGGQQAFDAIEGITYSEYAVQGFNELATVAVLVLLLILSLRYLHGVKSLKKSVNLAEILLLVQTSALLISAWTRMQMYVAEYGFTPARIFGLWFFVLTAILLIFLAVHIWKQLDQSKYMRQSFVIVGILMLIFVGMAPDALSVKMNITRAQKTGEQMDPFPLFNQLSAEAYPLMNYVLTSGEVDIGLINTSIEDYCPFVRAHYRDNKIFNFTFIIERDKDEALAQDASTRISIARFQNYWEAVPEDEEIDHWSNKDWRSWNLSRSMLPERTQQEIDDRGIPYPADEIAHSCGIFEGDLKVE